MEKWSKLNLDHKVYIIKYDQSSTENSDSMVTCWLSDFKHLWKESIETIENLQKRFSEQNRRYEIKNDQLIETIVKLSANICNSKIESNDDKLKLHFDYPFSEDIFVKFYWLLERCDHQEFYENISMPMLKQMIELQANRTKLIEIIEKKDQEIEQYKLDGAAPLMRKQFITKPFENVDADLQFKMFSSDISEFSNALIGTDQLMETTVSDVQAKDNVETKSSNSIKDDSMIIASCSSKARNRKGFTIIKRIEAVTYEENDSDDDSQSKKQQITQDVVKTNSHATSSKQTKRIRKIPNL